MKFLTIIKTIVSLLPLIIEAIKAVEEAIPGQGKGEAKLAAIRAILEGAYATAQDLGVTFADLWPALEKTIGGLVSAFNSSGMFKK